MEEELYDAYVAICKELGMEPADLSRFRVALSAGLNSARVSRIGGEFDTWLLVRDDGRDGCDRCTASIADFISHFYSGDENAVFSSESATGLIAGFHHLHDLSIGVTNAYGAQNWSCVVAAADCPECADARQSVTPPALLGASPKANDTAADISDTGGQRTVSADAFVDNNRWAFGFASVVGNPVAVPEAESVTLVNAPIRTSVDVTRCEIAGGKGISPEQALASCLGEAFERYSLANADRSGVVVGTVTEIPESIDIATAFGFPVNDKHPSIEPLTERTVLEWMDAMDLDTGQPVRIPVNFAMCPYASGPYATIVAGSTNGAAAGATPEDARAQALREIVERDAFWYYARTGAQPLHIDLETLPPDIVVAMGGFPGVFSVTLLPNPFKAPVANVAFVPRPDFKTKAARGSGHSSTVVGSVRRALAECIQMLFSLDSGIDVDEVATDMRQLWFSGLAAHAMPNFFTVSSVALSLDRASERFLEAQSTDDLIRSAARQGLATYEMALAHEPGFSVVKVVMSGASVSDALYFEGCDRFDKFASLLDHPEPHIRYSGSLFM